MSKDGFRFDYDPLAALANCPKLLGMELVPRGNGLQGGYYLNGDRHPYRRDKLKVFVGRGSVWISEEGGRCVSLTQWLREFGGAETYRDAVRMINGEPQSVDWNREFRRIVSPDVKYVPKDVLEAARAYDLGRCPLFRWMCGLFPEADVRGVWGRYNVTTDSKGNAVFWFTDSAGRVLFDKRMAYGEDGHRLRDFFPGRKYRVGDGYTGRCYFGAHLVDQGRKVYVCESEKTCLLVALAYPGRQCVATGGKGNLRDVDANTVLLPDMDARFEWQEKGEIWPWWEKWGVKEIPDKGDIGDMIVWKRVRDLNLIVL